jgi:serine/threonine protein phosphatase PrpC
LRLFSKGVADGVGGWHEYGIDPSKFSFNLMKTCKRLVEQQEADFQVNAKTPLNLLEQSYQTLLEDKNNSYLVGSSTACILLFHHDTNLLHTCNLGDSGFVIVRANRIIHRSQEQQHYFNSPYQIAILPSSSSSSSSNSSSASTTQANSNYQNLNNNEQGVGEEEEEARRPIFRGNPDDETTTRRSRRTGEESLINDSPDSAISSSLELREGDFIVIGTDGLWDNLNESHLLIEIAKIKVNNLF